MGGTAAVHSRLHQPYGIGGVALLFGLGTMALPSWDSKMRWNNLSGGLAVG
jgi:hypothetical protein